MSHAYQIIPYDPLYQERIDRMMRSIAAEFSEPISLPESRPLPEQAALPGYFFWMAVSEEHLLGMVGVTLSPTGLAQLRRMMVDPQHRGSNGPAADLLRTAETFAATQGAHTMILGTMSQMHAAQQFYRKKGYTPLMEWPSAFPHFPLDDRFFSKPLNA